MCRLLEEQAAAFGLEKTHINLMQSLVDRLQTNVHRAWARRKTHDADHPNIVIDELKALLVETQSEARTAAATAAQHIETLTDDVRRRDDLVHRLKDAAAAAATAANVRISCWSYDHESLHASTTLSRAKPSDGTRLVCVAGPNRGADGGHATGERRVQHSGADARRRDEAGIRLAERPGRCDPASRAPAGQIHLREARVARGGGAHAP